MKKKSLIGLCLLPLILAMVVLFPACKKNNEGAPSISDVRQYVASPKDTVLSTGNPNTSPPLYGNGGYYVVIQGSNLQNPTEIDFDGVPSNFNPALITSNNAVVPIPTINYTTIDTTKLYSINYKTKAGSTTFWFKLGPQKPTITAISNVFANPGDSVYLYGANLVLVQNFIYGGSKITSFNSSSDGTSLGFLMPATTPTSLITVTTKSGTVLDTINATPAITSISNENANPGDSVYVYGNYLRDVQALTFAGVTINSWKNTYLSTGSASSIGFVMPSGAQTAKVSVTTKFGTGTTPYKVNAHIYQQDGVIETMDGPMWTFGGMDGWWAAGGGGIDNASNDIYGWFTHTTAFDGVLGTNQTQFVFLNLGALDSGTGGYSDQATRTGGNDVWVPKANLSDPVDSWAIKLEISVPKAWNGGSLCFTTDFGGSTYEVRYEPWQVSGQAIPYINKGWQTLTIPFSSFRASDPTLGAGKGASITSLTQVLGSTGNPGKMTIFIHNYGTAKTATGFYGAFDNIRVVKIK